MSRNYLMDKNIKFDKKIKKNLEELTEITKSNCTSLLMFDTFKDFILFQQNSHGKENKDHDQYLESLSFKYFKDNESDFDNNYDLNEFKLLDHDKIIDRVKYHGAGDSTVVGYIILHFDDNMDLKILKNLDKNKEVISKLINEIKYLAELTFLKSENYSRLYSLIDILQDVIKFKDSLSPIHMSNVSNWAMEIAKKLNLDDLTSVNLYFASILHDIGKLYISDSILVKKGQLTEAEFEEIREHSEKGYLVSKSVFLGIPTLLDVPLYIRHHHEWYDGNGYPSGLKGNEIPFLSQIIGICDAVDAMMSKRSYANVKSKTEVINELVRCSGTQFNPMLVDIMLTLFEEKNNNALKTFVFENKMFIPNVSVSFLHKDLRNIVTFKGNLIISKSGGKITLHDDIYLKRYNLKDVYHMKMIFFDRDRLYEFSIIPKIFSDDGLYLEKLTQLPDDKYFAVYWDLEVTINSKINVKCFRIGASSLVFSLDINEENKYSIKELGTKINSMVDIDVLFELCEITELISMKAILKSVYDTGGKLVYYISYHDINDSLRDRVFRYLFKKQIECKRKDSNKVS